MSAGGPDRVDVAVIGGGVIGLALAVELLRRGRRVTVLERGRAGAGATQAAAGMLAPVSEADVERPALVAWGLASLGRIPTWVEGLKRATGIDCGYRTEGTLWVAMNRDDAEELEQLAATLHDRGLRAEPLTDEATVRHEPHLAGRVVAGLFVAGDHQIDPRALTRALVAAVAGLGGTLAEQTHVDQIDPAAGGFAVRAGGRDWRAEQVVVAAGAWAAAALHPALRPFAVRPVKGQLLRLRGTPLVRHVLRTPDVYLVPRSDGELLVGGTVEERGFDTQATAGAVMDLTRRAWQLVPAIAELEFVEVSVGLRPALPDHLPAVGPAPGVENLFLALGHYRNGVLLAPVTAAALAEGMCSGRMPAELGPFLPASRAAGSPAQVESS